jgi:hypothetical protein
LINKKRREKKGMHQYVPPVLGKEKRTGPAVIVWKSNDELSYRSAGRRSKTPSAAAAPGGSDARRRRKTMKWRLPGAWAFVAENKLYLLHPSPCRPVPKCPLARVAIVDGGARRGRDGHVERGRDGDGRTGASSVCA